MLSTNIELDHDRIAELCRRWKVRELSLFGSVIRDDFRPDSDGDVLVTFDPEASWSLWDFIDLRDELAELFGRKVDLVEEEALRNPFRRHAILKDKTVIYGSG